MKYESIATGEEKISGCEVDKVGAYSYQRKYYSYLKSLFLSKYLKVTLQITMLFQTIQIITMIGKRHLNLYLTMTMFTMMTLNRTIKLPILL